MAPKKTDNGNEADGPAFTDREGKMASLALKLLPESAKKGINFELFVSEFGQKDVKSARECFRVACKKHGWFEGTNGIGSPAQATPKKSATKRSRAKASADGNGSDVEETPTKQRKVATKKATPAKATPSVSSEDGLADFIDGVA